MRTGQKTAKKGKGRSAGRTKPAIAARQPKRGNRAGKRASHSKRINKRPKHARRTSQRPVRAQGLGQYLHRLLANKTALLVFIAILVLTLVLVNNLQPSLEKQVGQRLEQVILKEDNTLTQDKLLELSEMDYSELKQQLGLSSDFYIHLEDENGNPIPISNNTYCIGSPRGQVNGVNCN